MNDQDRRGTIRRLLEASDWTALQASLLALPEPEIADLLSRLKKADRIVVLRLLPRDLAGDVFSYLELNEQNALLASLTDEETRQILASMSPDDRTQLLGELPGQITQRLLNLLDRSDLREARELLGYPPESVGRLMTPDYVAVRPEWTIARALTHIRHKGRSLETVATVYVTDHRWKLLDAMDLSRFVLAEPTDTVSQYMEHRLIHLSAFDDRERAVTLIQKYDLSALPVVDSQGTLLGIVTVDDVLDVAQEEATEDFYRVGGVTPLKTRFKNATFRELYGRRIGWLLALIFMNLFSGAVLASYEATIAAAVALVFFLPLLIDSGGNAGSQSATLMVRALAMGEVRMGDWSRLIGKELAVATALGVTMGLAVWGVGLYRGGPQIAIVVALTMGLVVVIGSLIGLSLPFLLSRLKLDPATASGPLITTIADIAGVLIYLSIATWFLGL